MGRHVVEALLDRGADVVAIDRRALSRPSAIDSRATILATDIFQVEGDVMAEFGYPDVCVHLAWEDGFVHNSPVHMDRLSDHFRFLTSLTRAGLKQLVVLGSMHEVGYVEGAIDDTTPTNPMSLYGIAKDSLRRSLSVSLEGKDTVLQWLRCFYVYGHDEGGQSIFSKISAAAARGDETFPFTSGKSKYDFLEVRELSEQVAAVAMQTDVDGVINCGSGEATELRAQVEQYIQDRGFDLRLLYGAYPDRPYDSPGVWGNNRKIRSIMANASGALLA